MLWEDVCQIIERNKEALTVNDIIDRIMLNETKQKEQGKNYNSYEEKVKNYLGQAAYNYLSEYDRMYIVSAQILLSQNIILNEYSPVLCPVAKALEGYLKKTLVEIGLEDRKNIIKSNWTFGNIIHNRKIEEECLNKVKQKYKTNIENIKCTIIDVYNEIQTFRNNISHSSGGLKNQLIVDNYNDAKHKYDEILLLIKDTYKKIFDCNN
ncbi:hypothetical protein [Caloramator sp. E03]|uniref:hypothetical protein n=1 Tax=Caloramator sp. E03 TaxID=2576307 RepID=UPI001FAB1DA6|nr:hypothetical protein [Caloramator sp. E03]